jgi:hypothetical protein
MVRFNFPRSVATAALAATALAGFAAAQGALASAITYSYLNVDNFAIAVSTEPGVTFRPSGITNQADLSATLNGTSLANGGTSPTIPLDITMRCVGTGCGGIGENDFTQHPGGEFSRADSLLDAPTASGTAQSQQVSETNLGGPGSGSATSRNGLIASFQFQLVGPTTDGGTLDISFDASRLMDVLLGQPLGTASASTAFRVTIVDRSTPSGTALIWAPNGLLGAGDVGGYIGGTELADAFNINSGISRVDSTVEASVDEDGFFHIVSNLFPTNTIFDFNLFSNTDTSAVQPRAVTEPIGPASIGIMLVLASMYFQRRRRGA